MNQTIKTNKTFHYISDTPFIFRYSAYILDTIFKYPKNIPKLLFRKI